MLEVLNFSVLKNTRYEIFVLHFLGQNTSLIFLFRRDIYFGKVLRGISLSQLLKVCTTTAPESFWSENGFFTRTYQRNCPFYSK